MDNLIEGISFDDFIDDTDEINKIKAESIYRNHERIGETIKNKYGSSFEIIEYNGRHGLTLATTAVNPSNGQIVNVITRNKHYENFKRAKVGSPYDKTLYGRACIGRVDNASDDFYYKFYSHMLSRVFSPNMYEREETYKNTCINPYFLSFENFKRWAENNYYEFEGETMCLDKDILVKGNKEYSPIKCMFVPKRINSLFVKADSIRGNLPIGVSSYECTVNGCTYTRYSVHCCRSQLKSIKKSGFTTPEEAFYCYKSLKEEEIKRVADYYWFDKGGQYIPQFSLVYSAMYKYTVDIND